MLMTTQESTWRQVNTRRWSPWSMLESALLQAAWASAGGVVLYVETGTYHSYTPPMDWGENLIGILGGWLNVGFLSARVRNASIIRS